MRFVGINYWAVLAAGVAGFLVGWPWYHFLAKQWCDAVGKNPKDIKPKPGPFITAILAQLAMAFVLAGAVGHLGQVTIRSSVISAVILWFGFVVTTLAVSQAFQGQKKKLLLIDGGHWLVVLIVMGIVIGAMGI